MAKRLNRKQRAAVSAFTAVWDATRGSASGLEELVKVLKRIRELEIPLASLCGEPLSVRSIPGTDSWRYEITTQRSGRNLIALNCRLDERCRPELMELLGLELCGGLHHPADLDDAIYDAYAAQAEEVFGPSGGLFACEICGQESISYRASLEHELAAHGLQTPDPRPRIQN